MPTRPKYTVYDAVSKRYLAGFRKPVKGVDAAVTRWTRRPEQAMRFPGVKSARGVAHWLGMDGRYGGYVVLNAREEIV